MSSKEKELIEATASLCKHVSDNLPEGWEIILTMQQGFALIELINPDGEEVEYDAEFGKSDIRGMCDLANEIEEKNATR